MNNKSYPTAWYGDDAPGAAGYVYDGGYATRRLVRPKEEWAGISLGRSYDAVTPWPYRREAQIAFYEQVRRIQQAIRKLKGQDEDAQVAGTVKPQLAAFYTSYPNPAMAAIAHTGFLELKSVSKNLAAEIKNTQWPAAAQRHPVCVEGALERVVMQTSEALANRAVLEEAAHFEGLACIEHYRLFQAAQCSLRFDRLADIIEAVVLYGDVLPPVSTIALNEVTAEIMARLAQVSADYYDLLQLVTPAEFAQLFTAWGAELIDSLAPMLPRKKRERSAPAGATPRARATGASGGNAGLRYEEQEKPPEALTQTIPPLDEPHVPMLDGDGPDARSAMRDAMESFLSEQTQEPGDETEHPRHDANDSAAQELREAVDELVEVAAAASGKTSEYEDLREDLLEQQLAEEGYTHGPMEGTPTEGQLVEFSMDGEEVGGQLKDQPMALCDDLDKVERLRQEIAPLTQALRKNLYPSTEERPRVEYVHTSGQLDPKRLPLADFCDAAFRRYRIDDEPSTRGKAVLLIAADGSASLSEPQMKTCKLLTAAWLESAHRANVRVLSALYHSEGTAFTCGAPLVQWIFHPRKSPVRNPAEAVRAVASLPDTGTGAQADAVSLKYMLDEAVALAKGSQVYLTLISDCAWNRCFFHTNKSPEEEVASVLETFKNELGDRFHITLVALEEREQKRIRALVDKEIVVSEDMLGAPAEVAEHISAYVASCIRERRRARKRTR